VFISKLIIQGAISFKLGSDKTYIGQSFKRRDGLINLLGSDKSPTDILAILLSNIDPNAIEKINTTIHNIIHMVYQVLDLFFTVINLYALTIIKAKPNKNKNPKNITTKVCSNVLAVCGVTPMLLI
jgi:hypothetical protein